MELQIDNDLVSIRAKVRRLRTALVSRCVQRNQHSSGRPGLPILPEQRLVVEDGQVPLEKTLTKILVEMLLDPTTSLPLDVDSMHKKMLRGPAAERYERVMTSLGLPSVSPLVYKLGTPPLGLLEVLVLEISGRVKTFVTDMDRIGLSRYAQVEDTGMIVMMRQQQMRQAATLAAAAAAGGVVPIAMMPAVAAPIAMMPPTHGPGMGVGPRPPPMPPPGMPPFLPGGPPPPPKGPPPPPPSAPPPSHGGNSTDGGGGGGGEAAGGAKRPRDTDLASLLKMKTAREMNAADVREADPLAEILAKPSAKEAATLDKFRTEGGASAIREHCQHLTKEDCRSASGSRTACHKLHFQKLTFDWTDPSLGNCSYLDTCRNMRTCRHIHYKLDQSSDVFAPGGVRSILPSRGGGPMGGSGTGTGPNKLTLAVPEATQWINCDIRSFDMTILGKFGVIMADPPWEIHQELPYGTMGDEEMRNLNIGCLQDDGVIFLWVTGRAMELGRECLEIWGYKRVDELIWVKTNQLQQLIRTGRTGHWLNHSKEHCLVGYKGSATALNRRVDCDVLVADVRETSRKPDEMYTLLERLSPGSRKIEIFARPNNLQAAHGWIGLGNQLNGSRLIEPDLRERYVQVYGAIKEPDLSKPAP